MASKETKQRILLVDDDPNILHLVQLYLTKEGYATETAADGAKAVQLFKANPPSLMLLDVLLPGMDGWQVLREIRK
ncbi:MAG: response regulator, partial [Oscillospiraceae bacterium]|nr:response regulator [Oscillospiraceae bacterium]